MTPRQAKTLEEAWDSAEESMSIARKGFASGMVPLVVIFAEAGVSADGLVELSRNVHQFWLWNVGTEDRKDLMTTAARDADMPTNDISLTDD